MNPFIQALVGSVVRTALVYLMGRFSLQFSDTQMAEVTANVLAIGMFGWSQFNVYRNQQKQLVAAASPVKMTMEQVDEKIAAGEAPSVMTPKTEIPTISA